MRVEAFFYTLSKQRIFPEAMLRICPGYRPADNGEPVAPPGKASAATGEPSAESLKFPEAVLGAFTGDRRKKACSLSRLFEFGR